MSLKLYIDENVNRAITQGLRRRGVDVLTVQEDGKSGIDDLLVFERASELERVIFSNDIDFVKEANRRLARCEPCPGVIYTRPDQLSVARCIADLELIAATCEAEEYIGRVEYLPL